MTLIEEIELLRDCLYRVTDNGSDLQSTEVLELSCHLDKLIVRFQSEENWRTQVESA